MIEPALMQLREQIAALDPYTAKGTRGSGFDTADLCTEYVRAFQDHVVALIDAAIAADHDRSNREAQVQAAYHSDPDGDLEGYDGA